VRNACYILIQNDLSSRFLLKYVNIRTYELILLVLYGSETWSRTLSLWLPMCGGYGIFWGSYVVEFNSF
jgi:hypothetical protein